MQKRVAENVFLLLVLVVALALFVGSLDVRVFTQEPVTAKTYGCAIALILAAVTLVQLVKNVRAQSRHEDAGGKIRIQEPAKVVAVILLTVFYCFGISNIGFYTTTYVYTLVTLLLLADRRTPPAIVAYAAGSLVFCIAIYGLFQVMKVYLPVTPLI